MVVADVLETRISTRARKGQESQSYLKHDCCPQNENDISIVHVHDTVAENWAKNYKWTEIGYILCKVYMCGNSQS